MNYKKTKKNQKQKVTHLISPSLITHKRFNDVISQLKDQTVLSNYDRYLYGYSFLQTQQHLNALITLWPLISKTQTVLWDDCATIADHVFKDESLLSSELLSEEVLHTLFLAAGTLAPQNPMYHTLKQRLFDSLWHQNNYEKLERILKSTKDPKTVFLIENLGKLAFFQAKSKLAGSIPSLIGLVLTGGACLLMQHSIYHADIEEEIHALGHEIKRLLSEIEAKGTQQLAWDMALRESFIDYETGILIEALQNRLHEGETSLDVIPTPSYLITYDGKDGQLSQTFLPWLSKQNHALAELYQAGTQQAVIWVLGGKKLSAIKDILKSVQKNKLHPYLRLAIMLRAESLKKSSLSGLVLVNEFETVETTTSVFKNIALQTAKMITNNTHSTIESHSIWPMLIDFFPVLDDEDLKHSILSSSLAIVHQQYMRRETLNFGALQAIAHQLECADLDQQLTVFADRQKICLALLANIADIKPSKKIITAIKNEPTLRAHLTLIVDSYFFASDKTSFWRLIQHIQSLVENKRINKFISLKDYFECDFNCGCNSCIQTLFKDDIPSIIEKLNLPVIQFPVVSHTKNRRTDVKKSNVSVLSQPDPFMTLGISVMESKSMIMQKMMQLIQQTPDNMAAFRQAQSELFNPTQRFLHHFLRIFNHEHSRPIKLDGSDPSNCLAFSLNDIPLRHELFNAQQ